MRKRERKKERVRDREREREREKEREREGLLPSFVKRFKVELRIHLLQHEVKTLLLAKVFDREDIECSSFLISIQNCCTQTSTNVCTLRHADPSHTGTQDTIHTQN